MHFDAAKPVYLSGPMTGRPHHNFPAFNSVAARLRHMGLSIVNPAELDGGRTDLGGWEFYLNRDLRAMLGCGAVAVMRDWQTSRGASLEVYVARQVGMPILDCDTLEPWGVSPMGWEGQLVGLWGAARVGKDTVWSHTGWPRAAFADALKQDLVPTSKQLGLDMAKSEDKTKARDLLVEYGRLGRKVDPDYWIKRLYLPPGRCMVTDVRYWNEVRWILGKGGIVVELVRDGIEPANDEERRSFEEIRREAAKAGIVIPVVHQETGRPEMAAGMVVALAAQHFGLAGDSLAGTGVPHSGQRSGLARTS